MGKIRVHELAKELGKSSGDVIAVLAGMGITDAKPASGIEDSAAMKVREKFSAPSKTEPSVAKAAVSSALKEGDRKEAMAKEGVPKENGTKASGGGDKPSRAGTDSVPKENGTKGSGGGESAPKKKKFVAVFRRENARSGVISRMPTKQAQLRGSAPVAHSARGPVRRRPQDASGRPVDPNARPVRMQEGPVPAPRNMDRQQRESYVPAQQPAASAVSRNAAPSHDQRPSQAPAAQSQASSQAAAKPAQKTAPAAAVRKEGTSPASQSLAPKGTGTRRPAPAPGPQNTRRPSSGERYSQRTEAKGGEGRRPSDRAKGSQTQSRPAPAGGQFAGKGAQPGSRPQAASGRNAQGRNSSSRKGFDPNRENAPGRGKNASGRRDQKDRSEKYNRYDANERVQTGRRRKDPNKQAARPEPVKVEEKIKTIILPDHITLKELADRMKTPASAIIKKLFMGGRMVTMNSDLTYEEAEEIALEYEILCEHEEKRDLIADLLKEEDESEENLVSRPPVVCVMGHVDHGKTSLLDAIRDTHVTDRESGGITQHIGASVIHYNDRTITFLDTPGHEAFTAMRMRGANSTDIAVLVVAADDGVMPQTVEAINHAKAAGIEIIVAINKIDKPSANIDRVKQELTEYELIAEDWGGSTTMVPVSAKSHEGIDDLLEMILLTADVMELKSNPNRRARGLVIEAKLDKGRGPVASLLIQKGTLHVGDPIDAGSCFGKVRAMTDDKGRRVKEAGPSMPVEVIGFSDVPGAGEIFTSPETEKEAKSFAATFITVGKEKMIEESRKRTSLDDLFNQIKEGTLKDLNLIVKADVQGSVEALRQSLLKLSNEEVIVKIIHSAVGAINESDVTLASASNAIIIGFNVRPDAQAKSTAEHEGVDIRLYKVIYDAINDVENAMKGMLEPVYEEKITGHVEIRQIFKASGVGNIAGSYVLDGVVQRGSKARITRDGTQIFDGAIASLKRFKDDVKEVRAGYECGLVFDGFSEIREGDQAEVYQMVEVSRS